jgi:hypothetical protein
MEWSPVYHIKGWGKFNRHYGDFCTGADTGVKKDYDGIVVALVLLALVTAVIALLSLKKPV